jgi:hypothetical protein
MVWYSGHSLFRPVSLAYQPLVSSTFLSEQTSHQQPASITLLSEQSSTGHYFSLFTSGKGSKVGWLLLLSAPRRIWSWSNLVTESDRKNRQGGGRPLYVLHLQNDFAADISQLSLQK